jgi:aminopeptidase
VGSERPRRSSGALGLNPASILREHPIDPSVVEGARNAVWTCLQISRGHELVIIAEAEHEPLAAAFLKEAEALGARVEVHLVDARKASHEPFVKQLSSQLKRTDASLFLGTLDGLPPAFRHELVDVAGSKRKHGHMPGITVPMMQQAMRTDYAEVRALSRSLLAKLQRGATISVRAPRGTALEVRCGARVRWHAEDGILDAPGWTNLPAGELLTCPESVDGVLVPDGGVWDALGVPVKHADRLRMSFIDGELRELEGGAGTEPELLIAQLEAHEHGRRVGQVAFGTNIGVVAAVGNLLQDLKMPGFHLSLGHSCPQHTRADWDCAVEIPLLVRRADVDVDSVPVLRGGRYVAPFA